MLLKIKKLRENKKLSTYYVAVQLEISLADYIKIEMGIKDVRLSKLDKLAKIFEVNIAELFVWNLNSEATNTGKFLYLYYNF